MRKSAQSYEQIIGDLQKKIYQPVYFLTGDEPYYIDKITDFAAKNILTPEEQSFNQTILYGKDSDAVGVTNHAKRFPMMANHQVIIVKEAQEVKNFDDLVHYIENPLKSTVLLLNYKYKTLDKRKKIYKALQQNAVIFESKKLYDDKVPGWIAGYLKQKKYQIEPKAAVLLTEFLGNELSKISNELDKLVLTLPEGMSIITADHIERNIGISKEYNNFELQNALVARDVLKANRIIRYFADNQKNHHISQTIIHLYFFYSKILLYHGLKDKSRQNVAASLKVHPFFVSEYEKAARIYNIKRTARIISWLRDYDLKSKGYGGSGSRPGDLMKELIYKILH
jgi:DNA polymerase-3 subunit delta